MTLSRRNFVRAASVGGIGALATPLIAARGSEAMAGWGESGFYPEPSLSPAIMSAVEERVAYRTKFANAIRLDSNENPNGPGAKALEAVRAMFTEANRYPDDQEGDLAGVIATNFKVKPENVLTAAGSGEILRSACYAFTGPGKALVTASPSFETPVGFTEFMGGEVRKVPVDGNLKLDLAKMLDVIEGAGLVFLCNPNNPTGTVHGAQVVKDFIAQVNRRAPNCMIMVDEAYHEYVGDPSYATSIPVALANPKVFTVRTFSKVFGMAGLRAGYAIGTPEALRPMARHKLSSGVSVLASAAGMATMPDSAHIAKEVRINNEAREFTRKAFASLGFNAPASNANFIMVPIGRDTRAFKDACAKHGILVGRPFPPLTTHSRISIGTMDEMKKAVDVFKQVLTSSANQ
jgi:histidinol-phosphate aminotransferase